MKQKNAVLYVVKIATAGLIAFVLLTLFCMLYKNEPIHYTDPDGASDYRWTANAFHSQATEGFSWGVTNNEGYYSLRDYYSGDQIDILILGSSQMEAAQVKTEDSAAAQLEKKLNDQTVYNIGTSGHTFLTCACNLKSALQKYRPTSFVVIQTDSLSFSEEEIRQAVEGAIPEIPSYNGGIIGLLQKNQFLRLLYHQYQTLAEKKANNDIPEDVTVATTEAVSHEKRLLLAQLLSIMKENVDEYNAKLIILYHPGIKLNTDGDMLLTGNPEGSDDFRQICDEKGIIFADMSRRFTDEYQSGYVLPYGFANTPVGSGHLNSYGHTMIADELYSIIQEVR